MRIRVSVGTLILLIGAGIFCFWRGGVGALGEATAMWGAVAIAAALHEVGHLLAAWGMAVRVRGLSLDVMGARLALGGVLSYGQEAVVALGGPFMSVAVGALLWPLGGGDGVVGSFGEMVCAASLGLGVFNLLPVETMDGGRMVRCLVAVMAGERVAAAVIRWCTVVVLGGMWMVAGYGMLVTGEMVGLFGFAGCFLGRLLVREDG